jgi:isopenicillin-N epimerase
VQAACHQLLCQAVEQICELTGLGPLSPLDNDFFSQMASVPLPAVPNMAKLKDCLYDEYRIEIPLYKWKERQLIRISVQGYNTSEDLEALVFALSEVL